jgi:hypothetical protein
LIGYYSRAGLDLTQAVPTGSPLGAIAIQATQKITLSGTNASQRYIDYSGSYLEYSNGSAALLKVDDSGNVTAYASVNAPAFSNSGTAPAFPNGLAVNATQKLSLNLNGTRYFDYNGSSALEYSNGSTSLLRVDDSGNVIAKNAVQGAYVQLSVGYTVATLPTCNSGSRGGLAYVSDANAPAWNATLSGGGSTVVLAFCNGSTWTAH